MIKVVDLKKNYLSGKMRIPVLKGINLFVDTGEYVAITGRSGAGKSTLLYQLGLLDIPTSGEIFIDDIKVNNLNEKQRTNFRLANLGYVFQDYALLPELTAIENVVVPLFMLGMEKKEAYSLAKSALEKVGLGNKLDNLPSQLSGGEQQRVSIARAVAHNPKILFADEPTANLDSVTAAQIMNLFDDLHKQKQTIVMVTHEKIYADKADKIIKISDGLII